MCICIYEMGVYALTCTCGEGKNPCKGCWVLFYHSPSVRSALNTHSPSVRSALNSHSPSVQSVLDSHTTCRRQSGHPPSGRPESHDSTHTLDTFLISRYYTHVPVWHICSMPSDVYPVCTVHLMSSNGVGVSGAYKGRGLWDGARSGPTPRTGQYLPPEETSGTRTPC